MLEYDDSNIIYSCINYAKYALLSCMLVHDTDVYFNATCLKQQL